MKRLLVALIAALCFNAGATTAAALLIPSPVSLILAYNTYVKDQKKVYYIRVQSQAADFEAAKKQAFRLASEQVAGTVVLSESELRNSRLTRDEIITYSSGIVDEYKILDRVDGHNFVRLTVDIWIAESNMAQRVLARSATQHGVDGPALSTRVDSILEERRRGDDVFTAIIRDIPKRSFVIKTQTPLIQMDNQRNTWAVVDWEINWDSRFATAFYEAAKALGKPHEFCLTKCRPSVNRIEGFYFEDNTKQQMMLDYLRRLDLVLKTEVVDIYGRAMFRDCDRLSTDSYAPVGSLFGIDPQTSNMALISSPVRGQTQIKLGQNPNIMAVIEQIKAEVVPSSQCRRQ